MRLLGRVRGIRSEIRRALRATSMPARVRRDLVTLALAKRVALPAEWPVHLPSGVVYLSGTSLWEDTEVLYEVLGREIYNSPRLLCWCFVNAGPRPRDAAGRRGPPSPPRP